MHRFLAVDAHNGTAAALGAALSTVGLSIAPQSTAFTLMYPIVAAVASKVLYDVIAFGAQYVKAKVFKTTPPSVAVLEQQVAQDALSVVVTEAKTEEKRT